MSQAVSTSGSLLSVIVNPGSGSSAECGVTYVESLDLNNPVVLRELDSGSYVLYGKFKAYSGDDTIIVFESKLNANIVKSTDRSSVMIFNPVNSKVECLTIYNDSYERNDVALQDTEAILQKSKMLATSYPHIGYLGISGALKTENTNFFTSDYFAVEEGAIVRGAGAGFRGNTSIYAIYDENLTFTRGYKGHPINGEYGLENFSVDIKKGERYIRLCTPKSYANESYVEINWNARIYTDAKIRVLQNDIALHDIALQDIAPPIICDESGTVITVQNSADRPLRGLTVYGKTTQGGTSSEDAPVDPMGTGTSSPMRIVTAGRNLAALTPRITDHFGITSSYDAQTGVVSVTGTATKMAFVSYWLREPIPSGVPLVIGLGNVSSDSNITVRAQSESENTYTNVAMPNSTNRVVNKVFAHAFEFLSIRVNAGATVNMKLQIGVVAGSDITGYTWTHPGNPTSAQIIMPVLHFAVGGLLHGLPAVSGGNYTDENGQQWIADTVAYNAQAGTAQLVQRVESVTYFGGADENWVKGGSGSYFAIRRADKSSASSGLCTHYPALAINAGEYKVGFSAAMDKEYIRFRPTGYADMTVDQWRARREASPVTVLYALAEPVTTPITGDELAALTALRSRYPVTTIYNDAGAQMSARYVADTKKYVDAAQTKADENERNIGQLKDDLLDLKNRKIAIEEEVLKKPDYSSAIESLAREIKAIEKELNING